MLNLPKRATPEAAKRADLVALDLDSAGQLRGTDSAGNPVSLLPAAGAAIPLAQKGSANGVAPLDGAGRVPAANLPSYVDDVLEFANVAAFPVTGETGKLYLPLDTNRLHRWSGSAYIQLPASTSGPIENSGLTGGLDGIPFAATAGSPFTMARLGQIGVREAADGRQELFIPDWASSILVEGLSPTDWTINNAMLERAIRRANGLNFDGTGTRKARVSTVLVPAGNWPVKAASFRDALGNPLSVILYSAARSARFESQQGISGLGITAGFEMDIGAWQHSQALAAGAHQTIVSIGQGRSPRAPGVISSSSQDDIVTYIEVADASKYPLGKFVSIATGNVLPYTGTSTSTCKIADAARVLDVDLTTNRVYLNIRLEYQHFIELGISPANGIYANTGVLTLYDDSVKFELHSIELGGGLTTSGRTTARPDDLERGMYGRVKTAITSLTKSGTTATAITSVPHLMTTGLRVRVGGVGVGSEVYGVTTAVTVINANTYTYELRTVDDYNAAFPQAISAYPNTATGSDLHHVDAFPNLDSSSHAACIELTGVVSPLLDKCYINTPWNQGWRLVSCPGWRIFDLESDGARNHGTSLDNSVFGSILGYIGSMNNQSSQGIWIGGRLRNARHGVTTGSSEGNTFAPSNPAAGSSWWKYGQPNSCVMVDVIGYDAIGIMFDGHETDSGWIYINCFDRYARRGPGGGSYNGQSWHLRGRNISVINCGAEGASTFGIRIPAVEVPGFPFQYERNNTTTPVFEVLRYNVSSIVRTPTVAIVSASRAANVATYGFSAPHLMRVGDPVTIADLAPVTFNGNFTVASVVSPTVITAAQTGTTETATDQIGTGRITNAYAFAHTGDQFLRNTGAHIEDGSMIRFRGATQANFNVTVPARTYSDSTRSGTFIAPLRDDFNSLFPIAPSAAADTATGTITLTPISRNPLHIHNFVAKGIHRAHGSALIAFNQSALRWRSQVFITGGFTADGCSGMEIGAGVDVKGDLLTTMRHKFDTNGTSRVIAGRGIFAEGDARVSFMQQMFDASENTHGAASFCPVNQLGTSSVHIGHLMIRPHRVQRDLVLTCVENGDGLPGKRFGFGKLTIVDDMTTMPANFRILPAGQEVNFTWTGGGEQIVLPIRRASEEIGASQANAAFTRLAANFLAFDAEAASLEPLVGSGQVDVRANGATMFGVRPTIAAGANDSSASSPTLVTAFLPSGTRLIADTVMTGTETATGLECVLRGFYV